jgi:hypothetical protein
MKTHPILVCLSLVAGIALIVVGAAIAEKQRAGVSIEKTSVQIHPGTKISSDDQKALDAVLKHFDKSLYKIETYDRGKVVRKQGNLLDVDGSLVAEVKKALVDGGSFWAVQIGRADLTASTHQNNHVSNPAKIDLQESERLRTRVAPILQKYSQ